MIYDFHPKAEKEFVASINYYEECQDGLGLEFAQEVSTAIFDIAECSKKWPIFYPGIRRRLINRFPYAILYSEEKEKIYIIAVMHLSRDPKYWNSRLL